MNGSMAEMGGWKQLKNPIAKSWNVPGWEGSTGIIDSSSWVFIWIHQDHGWERGRGDGRWGLVSKSSCKIMDYSEMDRICRDL